MLKTCRTVLALTSLTLIATAQGGYNLDMGDLSYGTPAATYGAAAGQAGFWQEYDAAGMTVPGGLPLYDLSGAIVPGASVSATTINVFADFSFNNANTTGDAQALLDDLIDSSTSTVTIAGIANGTYDVWVYAWAPDARTTFFSDVTITGGANGLQHVGGMAWGGTYVNLGHYCKDRVTITNNTIVIDVANPPVITPTSINGVQIVPVAAPPTPYCTAGTSTNGCVPAIFANAQPSVSFANACTIGVNNVEGQKSGIVFYGTNNTGFSPAPWATGSNSFLCVKAPTQRTIAQNSGGTTGLCDGTLTLDWNAFQMANPTALGQPWMAGDKAYLQAWYRDPTAVKTTNLSGGLELTYQP